MRDFSRATDLRKLILRFLYAITETLNIKKYSNLQEENGKKDIQILKNSKKGKHKPQNNNSGFT